MRRVAELHSAREKQALATQIGSSLRTMPTNAEEHKGEAIMAQCTSRAVLPTVVIGGTRWRLRVVCRLRDAKHPRKAMGRTKTARHRSDRLMARDLRESDPPSSVGAAASVQCNIVHLHWCHLMRAQRIGLILNPNPRDIVLHCIIQNGS